jgi:hypothetical protein
MQNCASQNGFLMQVVDFQIIQTEIIGFWHRRVHRRRRRAFRNVPECAASEMSPRFQVPSSERDEMRLSTESRYACSGLFNADGLFPAHWRKEFRLGIDGAMPSSKKGVPLCAALCRLAEGTAACQDLDGRRGHRC